MATAGGTQVLADQQALRALAAELCRDDLVVFPVRHHSPACALQLHRLLATTKPAAVLIEGPRSFTDLVPQLGHADAQAPFAIYTYAVLHGGDDGVRHAAWYPFCDHSPELVALRAGLGHGVPVRFVDLEFDEQRRLEQGRSEPDAEAGSLLDERHLRRSEHLRRLAERLGCRDHEELWEHLFETPARGVDVRTHVANVVAYCALARRDHPAAELAADGTLAREAEMAWHVQQALAERRAGDGPVVAVVGGFHAVELPRLLRERVERPAIGGPKVERRDRALVRYAFDRLDRLNGYAAGMTSPRWQDEVWQRMHRHERAGAADVRRARDEAALHLLGEIAHELRERHGLPLPLPTVVAAFEHVQRLAALRRRIAPAVDDLRDALLGCFVKGDADADGALVRAVAARALTGTTVGRVPAGTDRPPLVRDFDQRARRQRLKIDDTEPRKVVLDLYRRPEHRRTSRLLHGLVLLGVPFGFRTAGPDFVAGRHLDRLQEHWEYTFTPATEAALVEASVHGTTLPEAVARKFLDRLDALATEGHARDARIAAAMLSQGCVLGLHGQMPRLLAGLRDAIAGDAEFAAVASAACTIGLLHESREPLEARGIDELPAVLAATFERAIFLGRALPEAPADATPIVQGLQQLRELLASAAGAGLDAALFHDLVARIRREHPSSLLRGAAAGLLHAAGHGDAADLAQELEGTLRGREHGADAVAFLRGLLSTARELAWQEPRLLRGLDTLLGEWDERDFVRRLPELRLAFATMTPAETDRVAAALRTVAGGDVGRIVRHDLAAGAVQGNLEASAKVRALLADDGLAAWGAP